jgi:hypothetical protein
VSADVEELFTKRSFAWGVLIVGDAESSDIPTLPVGATVASTTTTVALAVRHAQDLDDVDESEFLVEVRCALGAGDADCIRESIAVPSGRLSVGDADHVDVMRVGPGRVHLHIDVEPEDMPERVTLWLATEGA